MGSVFYLGGGFGYFYVYVFEKWEYLINCFVMEIKCQFDVFDCYLVENIYMMGDDYMIVDIVIWFWYG